MIKGPADEKGYRSCHHQLRFDDGSKNGKLVKNLTYDEFVVWKEKLEGPMRENLAS